MPEGLRTAFVNYFGGASQSRFICQTGIYVVNAKRDVPGILPSQVLQLLLAVIHTIFA